MPRINPLVYSIAFACFSFSSCHSFQNNNTLTNIEEDSVNIAEPLREETTTDTTDFDPVSVSNAATKPTEFTNQVSPKELLAYAETLIGTPYKYASVNPAEGLDCSGFITHVFNRFSIRVPRSSIDFTNYGVTLHPGDAKPGDLILFTGTDTLAEVVGHMGIVSVVSDEELKFIHSTSGKAYGVTITSFNDHYSKRFVKVIRIPYTATPGL